MLCFDKTGTLTQNKLAVREVIPIGTATLKDIHRDLHCFLKNLAHLNNTAQAIDRYIDEVVGDGDFPLKVKEIPFSSGRKWAAVCLADKTLLMGAPERLLPSDGEDFQRAEALAADGMRVLAFGEMRGEPDLRAGVAAYDVKPLALIVMSDQIRDDIRDTLAAFREEGLTLKVISGDNIETVRAIAAASGMDIGSRAYAGAELDAMGEGEFDSAVQESHVFARIEPDTKQRIVEALRRNGEYVSMVGDGVNDVPALKEADLAIVMNDGTQISKDVADIVLLNNAMSTLPRAFREGKETTQTIFGTMKMFLVRNFFMVALFVCIAFLALPFSHHAGADQLGDFRHGQSARHLDRLRLAAPALHGAFPPRCAGLHRHHGLHRRGFDDAALSHRLVRRRRRLAHDALGDDDHGRALRHADHLAYPGHRLVQPRFFPAALAPPALEQRTDGVDHYRDVPVFPDLFEFNPPRWDGGDGSLMIVAIAALFLLTMALLSHGMRHRYLLNRFWDLLAPDRAD